MEEESERKEPLHWLIESAVCITLKPLINFCKSIKSLEAFA